MEIGIIGLGVAGISILKEIDKQMTEKMKGELNITVFSETEGFGTGFPYQPDDEALLINQYTETMSIDLDDPHHFLKWMKAKRQLTDLYNSHLPRTLFGEYLYEETLSLIDKLNVTVIREKVTAVRPIKKGQFNIVTDQSEKIVDSVHLSVGHLAYQDPYALKGLENYIYNPYPAIKKLDFPDQPLRIGILGTGLTAIDTYLYMKKTHPKASLSFLSLEGRFSSVRGHEPEIETHYICQESIKHLIERHEDTVSLEQIREWFQKETEDHGIDLPWVWEHLGKGTVEGMQRDLKHLEELGKFQAIIRKMRDCYALLWNALSDDERDEFLKGYGQQWSFFKAPIPQKTARLLIEDITEGRVKLFKNIQAITKEKQGFKVELGDYDDQVFEYIVNGTGQQMDLLKNSHLQQPVVRQLVEDEILKPYRYGGVLIDYPSMCAVDTNGEKQPALRVYGQLASGVHFGNSSVEMVAKSARYGVKAMLDDI
ncbi:FAD/NAD(P)-binding protein [Alkalibacterium putridalgicola]|uniref:FAD/NAD(P)-binding protein n=1 Tax=Alkalibacterium putridalgicola TaxID=426703 RepID=UPI0034CE4C53